MMTAEKPKLRPVSDWYCDDCGDRDSPIGWKTGVDPETNTYYLRCEKCDRLRESRKWHEQILNGHTHDTLSIGDYSVIVEMIRGLWGYTIWLCGDCIAGRRVPVWNQNDAAEAAEYALTLKMAGTMEKV